MVLSRVALVGVLLSVALTTACSSGTSVANPPTTTKPASDTAANAGRPGPTPATNDACSNPLDEKQALQLLVKLTTASAQDRIKLTVADARQIFQDEADYVAEGWPPNRDFNRWMKDGWTKADVKQSDAHSATITLHHGDAYASTTTVFGLECRDVWVVKRFGTVSGYTAKPPTVLRQDGDLTADLALALAKGDAENYANPAERFYATKSWLEVGRQFALYLNSGQGHFNGAQGLGPDEVSLQLQPQSDNQVVGLWKDGQGKQTGRRVLFRRVNGLWKVADYGDDKTWFGAAAKPRPVASIDDEYSFLGLQLNMSPADVQRVMGPPDQISDSKYIYSLRNIQVEVDAQSKVSRITAYSGATKRGLRVGDTIDTLHTLYGTPDDEVADYVEFIGTRQILRVRLQIDADGSQRVKGFSLLRR